MIDLPPAALALQNLEVPFQLFYHKGPIISLEQAANERGQLPEQVIRSIVFRIGDGIFVMVLAAGAEQISWPRLRAYLGQSRLTLASEAEVLSITGYRVGAVSPFGILTPLRILADENIFKHEDISIGSGERGVALLMKSTHLRHALLNIEISKFLKSD